MGFSSEWDNVYKENTHMSIWPWSDLVKYVMRYAKPAGNDFRVLELGCGAGANIPFFEKLGVDYFTVEGSSVVAEKLKTLYPRYAQNIVIGDFTKEFPFSENFDLIVDRGALTCNFTGAIRSALTLAYSRLKKDCLFIGIDWYSTESSEFKNGEPTEDIFTRRKFESGPFAGIGNVHFSDKDHLFDLFRQFTLEVLEHKISYAAIPQSNMICAAWNFAARKK